ISIALADFKVDRVSGRNTVPLAAAEKIAFQAELDPVTTAATQKAAYDLTSDITAGELPSGPPIDARPIEARFKAVFPRNGDMIPKPLPERIKGWQRNGGTAEVTRAEVRGNSSNANGQGTLRLSANGGLDGALDLSGAQYDRLFAALTGK